MMKTKVRFYSIGILLLIIVAALASLAVLIYRGNKEERLGEQAIQSVIAEKTAACEKIRRLDGLCLAEEEEPLVYAVMIDNHVLSRPQSGLGQASLVYEAVAESPITRFLAVFYADEKINKIGPVRSARPFYVDWAKEFKGPYLHVGGSDNALDTLAKTYSFDLNEFSNGKYFWRAWTRSQPHNVYTSNELLAKAVENKKWAVKNDFASWPFIPEEQSRQESPAQTISIDFATADFVTQWQYNWVENDYLRFQAGEIHEDAEGGEIRAKNIAVMYTDSQVIDSYGRRETRTLGSGQAIVFSGGKVKKGTWKRATLGERTRFYDEAGREVAFYPGQTWIEVVPKHFPKVTY